MKRFRIPEDAEIHPADPGARVRAMIAVAVLAAVALTFAFFSVSMDLQIENWLRDHALKLAARPEILFLGAFVVMLPMAGISIYVFRLGSKIVKAERVPFPEQKVVRDTPIIRGKQAVRQGRIVQGLAVFMGFSSLILPFLLAIILMLLQQKT